MYHRVGGRGSTYAVEEGLRRIGGERLGRKNLL